MMVNGKITVATLCGVIDDDLNLPAARMAGTNPRNSVPGGRVYLT